MSTISRPELEPIPERMRRLKLHRGYPVPWFVAWLNEEKTAELLPGEGEPDFRIVRTTAVAEALQYHQCWVCGGRLGRYRAFVIGPMCIVNRVSAEPPSHRECAVWSSRNCPFLSRPRARRRDQDIGHLKENMPGIGIMRNPGLGCVWVTNKPTAIRRVPNGILLMLPDPTEVLFYAEGREATREEIQASIDSGLPILLDVCQDEGERAEVHLLAERAVAAYLPAG